MKLKKFLDEKNMSISEFAVSVGRSDKQIYAWINGSSIPRGDVMEKIYVVTGGNVRADDFYQMPPLNGGAVYQKTERCEVAHE